MRIPKLLGWLIVLASFGTAALLRRHHGGTPVSPYLHPSLGSLLFLFVFFLLVVTAWERRQGAVGGKGIRLGTITPLLLMLFVEKWASTGWYIPLFQTLFPQDADPRWLDAMFALYSGALLLIWCGLFRRFARPLVPVLTKWRAPGRAFEGAMIVIIAVIISMSLIWLVAFSKGLRPTLGFSLAGPTLVATLVGQGLLSFAEESYYRGVLLAETYRIGGRLGLKQIASRRWFALIITSLLFAFEHLRFNEDRPLAKALVFSCSLGILFGLIVLLRRNLWTATILHAWINALLLGAAPRWETEAGPLMGSGPLIGLVLIGTFIGVFLRAKRRTIAPPLSSS